MSDSITNIVLNDSVYDYSILDSAHNIYVSLQSSSNSTNELIITTLTTLLAVLGGYFVNVLFHRWKERKEANEIKTLYVEWITLLNPSIQKAIDSANLLAKMIKESKQPDNFSFEYIDLDFKRLLEIDAKLLVNVFVTRLIVEKGVKDKTNFKSKKLFNLLSSLDFIQGAQKEITEKYALYKTEIAKKISQHNELDEKIINKVNDKMSLEKGVDPLTTDYLAIYNKWSQLNETKFYFNNRKESLFLPLQEVTSKEYPTEYPLINKYIDQWLFVAKEWETMRDGFSDMFSQYAKGIDDSNKILQELVEYYRDKKIRF